MVIQFDVKKDKNNQICFFTTARGNDVIRAPLLNKGSAFTKEEREILGLDGLVPPRMLTIEQQIIKIYQRYQRLGSLFDMMKSFQGNAHEELPSLKKSINIARFNFLRDLQDRNEILFYAFCQKYMPEILPIIYTPTIGDAVMRFSRDSARFRGIFLSPNNITKLSSIFDHFRFKKPTIAVVTDNQGILGLGDQGVGGIDIPIGKLSLYVLGAGIPPWETMPITLDVGTDNPRDLQDPYYLGYKTGRLRGQEYEDFIDSFVTNIYEKFPGILIQWEDFSRQNAFTVLDKYRYNILSFNDDIQGTGSVALAGILNALRLSKEELHKQRFVIYGAGAGGVGIARRIAACIKKTSNLNIEQANENIAIIDSKGLVTDSRNTDNYKKPFSKKSNYYQKWDIKDSSRITLLEVIKNFQATALIGTSGCQGHFTTEILQEMTKHSERPIIFPLSNPTINSEAIPQDIYRVTKGKAIIATGSPFEPVTYRGQRIMIGQGNNFYIFPGVGLGAILSTGEYISDAVFTEAAKTLSEMTPVSLIKKGTVYPPITDIRKISAYIAYSTIEQIANEQDTPRLTLKQIKLSMWKPQYHPIVNYR
ncbi:MAG: NAD-dependent malic enzyme [Candidatus Thermoplasmatota archaeon]|nr:NAD-dependent malic enzyme [Candidatus Thermoplasmatota archaeon]